MNKLFQTILDTNVRLSNIYNSSSKTLMKIKNECSNESNIL